MASNTAEETLRSICDDAVKKKSRTSFIDEVTSEAFVDMLRIAAVLANDIKLAKSYTLEPLDGNAKDQRFQVRFLMDTGVLELQATMREVKGAWKIAALKIPGIRD